jgi:hypothetical protein
MREKGKDQFDRRHRIRTSPLEPGIMVVCFDSKGVMDMSNKFKLSMRWMGPYLIKEVNQEKGIYTLTELDGAQLAGTFAGNRIKRFYPRRAGDAADLEDEELEWLSSEEEEGEAEGRMVVTQRGRGSGRTVSHAQDARERGRTVVGSSRSRRSERLQKSEIEPARPAKEEGGVRVPVALPRPYVDLTNIPPPPPLHVERETEESWEARRVRTEQERRAALREEAARSQGRGGGKR